MRVLGWEWVVGALSLWLERSPDVGCEQGKQVQSIFLKSHSFWDVGSLLVGTDLGEV